MTLLIALLVGLSAPSSAVAHASVHAHVAEHEHGESRHPYPVMEDGHHGHEHAHAAIDTAAPNRQTYAADLVIAPAQVTEVKVAEPTETRAVTRLIPALRPRPGPERGPPFGPRAPPQS